MLPEQLIELMPGNLYWKDKDGYYLGANNELTRVLKCNSTMDIVGKNDTQLLGIHADKIIENDREVMTKEIGKIYLENGFDIKNNVTTYLSKKCPLYDKEHNLLGVMGISIDIGDKSIWRHSDFIIDSMMNQIVFNDHAPELTLRQTQCLNLLLYGLTAKAISLRLKISVRTVETHIKLIKEKFNCQSKAELINKILSLKFS